MTEQGHAYDDPTPEWVHNEQQAAESDDGAAEAAPEADEEQAPSDELG